MSDVPSGSQSPAKYTASPPAIGSAQSRLSTDGTLELQEPLDHYRDPQTTTLQYGSQSHFQTHSPQQFDSAISSRQNLPMPPQTSLTSPQAHMVQNQMSGREPSFNMATLGAALPPDTTNYGQGFGQQSHSRFPSGPSPAGPVYQIQQAHQFPGQAAVTHSLNPQYNMQYSQQYQGKYALQQTSSLLQQGSPSPGQQFVINQNFLPPAQQQQPPAYYYHSGQYGPSNQVHQASQQQSYGAQYGPRGGISSDGAFSAQQRGSENYGGQIELVGGSLARTGSTASAGGSSSVLRGPPRKPKQSGHALWVGNLPSGANVVDLKDHFSREATGDILSVFLISKSNCAFVNYRTEESCAAAMTRFHDSRFQGVRLVCRLRRSSVNAVSGVPTGPSATLGLQGTTTEVSPERQPVSQVPKAGTDSKQDSLATVSTKEKFFIVKSLTVEDLDLSVRNGVWATQSHNEEALNKAYESADNVYLIFSANKSGEYFGYARMASSINDDPAAAIEFAPKAQAVEDPDLPKAIPTPATEFAPKGRIIDDSARGTIFWEAEINQVDGAVENEEQRSDHSDQEAESKSQAKAWGKPFKIEWLSTNRLPFYRTRGLRNPWNSNREVKIARDGTELETSVGQRVIQMFHRDPSPTASNMPVPMHLMAGGYPQMRPY